MLSPDDRAWVNERLPPFFEAIKDVVRTSADDSAEPLSATPPNPFGYLSAKDRMSVFHDAMQRDIISRFEALGYAARSAWRG